MIKVMIVDDEYLVREHLKRGIQWETLGFQICVECSNGQEATQYFEQGKHQSEEGHIDLIIMDINMPVIDGLKATEYIRKITQSCYIIMLTGHDEFEYARRCIGLGVTSYILKPIHVVEVEKALRKVAEKKNCSAQRRACLIKETIQKVHVEEEVVKAYSKTVTDMMTLVNDEIGNKELSLNYISRQIYMNRSHLSRQFKEETGMNFNKYLTKVRMEKARELIKTTPMKNYEIAEAVGVTDPNYLSYAFKKELGITISDYRKTLDS